MTRSELQKALKALREQGLTSIKLTAKTEELQQEFDRVASCPIGFTPIPEPTVTEVPEQEDETLEVVPLESIVWFERYLFEVGLVMINERWLNFVDPRLEDYAVHWVPGEPGVVVVNHSFFGEIFRAYIFAPQLLMTLSSLRHFTSDFETENQKAFVRYKRNELEKLLNMPA
jgi:hypothetical protein